MRGWTDQPGAGGWGGMDLEDGWKMGDNGVGENKSLGRKWTLYDGRWEKEGWTRVLRCPSVIVLFFHLKNHTIKNNTTHLLP